MVDPPVVGAHLAWDGVFPVCCDSAAGGAVEGVGACAGAHLVSAVGAYPCFHTLIVTVSLLVFQRFSVFGGEWCGWSWTSTERGVEAGSA